MTRGVDYAFQVEVLCWDCWTTARANCPEKLSFTNNYGYRRQEHFINSGDHLSLCTQKKRREFWVFFCTFGKNVPWAIKCFLLGENSLPRDNRKESLGEKLGRRPGDWFANPAVVNWLYHPRLREVPSVFSRPQVCNLSGAECRASIL